MLCHCRSNDTRLPSLTGSPEVVIEMAKTFPPKTDAVVETNRPVIIINATANSLDRISILSHRKSNEGCSRRFHLPRCLVESPGRIRQASIFSRLTFDAGQAFC